MRKGHAWVGSIHGKVSVGMSSWSSPSPLKLSKLVVTRCFLKGLSPKGLRRACKWQKIRNSRESIYVVNSGPKKTTKMFSEPKAKRRHLTANCKRRNEIRDSKMEWAQENQRNAFTEYFLLRHGGLQFIPNSNSLCSLLLLISPFNGASS